jgi:predicted deacylase
MAQQTHWFTRLINHIQIHKTNSILLGLGLFAMLVYGLAFFIAKPVAFAYVDRTCVQQLTLIPAIHKATDTENFVVSFIDEIKIGSFALMSTKTCFSPVTEPKEGTSHVETAPFGGIFARKQFAVSIPAPPTVRAVALEKPLPISKPVVFDTSSTDTLFDYRIEQGEQSADCAWEEAVIRCDIPALKLKQGKMYSLKLTRQFKDGQKQVLVDKQVETLRAVTIKKASLKNKQTIYSKPTSFTFTADKPLANATAKLVTVEKKPQDIAVKTEVKDKTIVVRLSKQLARETTYRLILASVEATDGSTLIEPGKTIFTMSGGPKVVGINIGTSRVSSSAVAVIQFDQKLSSKVDINKYVSLTGGRAVITKHSSSVSVALQQLPRCQAFTLNVASGLASKHGITSKDSWKYSSRTICHTVTTYGTSIQGRALNAYIFGSTGPVTMYVGAIHGNESSSSGLMQAWINELERHPDRLKGKRIVVVPTINPDGLAAGTRTNSRGVNLNRNFPTDNWKRDIDDTDGKHKNGGGRKPLSEPEAKALASLTQQYRPRLLLSFHAVGSLVQGDNGSPSASYAATYASKVGYSNATGSGDTFDYGITGGYEDWAWRNNGTPAMVVELGSYSSYYIDHHAPALWAML